MAVHDRGELQEFRAQVRRFADARLTPWAGEIGEDGRIPDAMYRELAESGYLGATLPEEYGGSGLDLRHYCILLEEFSRAHSQFTLALTMTCGPIGKSIVEAGTEAQRQRIVPGICSGEVKVAFALSEPDAGSDAAAIRTRAERTDGGWKIFGRKHYITYAEGADYVQVMAVTDAGKRARGGITAFLVARDSPGFEISRIDLSIANDRLAELTFDGCFVPEDMVVGEVGDGFRIAVSSLVEGRLGIAASCHGAADRMMELAIDYSKARRTFGKPLAERQAIQWMLADSAIELEASRALLDRALDAYEARENVKMRSSMCKVFASEMACRVADRCVQIHGGAGVVRGVPIERLYREVRHYRIGEGTSEIQRMLIARDLLK